MWVSGWEDLPWQPQQGSHLCVTALWTAAQLPQAQGWDCGGWLGPGITPSAFGRSTVGTFTRWERAKKQSPESQGNALCSVLASLPFPLLPWGLQAP